MPKRIANGLTLLSAVVCVGSAMLVGRSFFQADQVTFPIGQNSNGWVETLGGYLLLVYNPSGSGEFRYYAVPPDSPGNLSELWEDFRGVPWVLSWDEDEWGGRLVILPLWLLPLLSAIAPVRWWRARRREGGRGFAVDGAASG